MVALLERGLEREGHVTTVTVDGAEGLDFAASRAFDVMILDVMLPVMNGLEVARRLRDQGVQTPILMLTARDTPRDAVAVSIPGRRLRHQTVLVRGAPRPDPGARAPSSRATEPRMDHFRFEARSGIPYVHAWRAQNPIDAS